MFRRSGARAARGRISSVAAAVPAVLGSISPTTASQYDAATVITVTGSGFVNGVSVITVDSVSQTTTFVSSTTLQCTLPAGSGSAILASSGSKTFAVTGATGSATLTVSAWAPTDVSGCTAWYRADSANVTTAGGAVSQWNDTSGNGRHLTQGNGSEQPQHTASDPNFNNRGSINFDGLNDVLTSSTAMSNFITASAGTVFSVIRADTLPTDSAISYSNTPVWSDVSSFAGFFIRGGSNVTRAYNWDGNEDYAETASAAVNTPVIYTWRHGSGNVGSRTNDGTEVTAASGNTADLTQNVHVGGVPAQTKWLDGKIAEVIFYNVSVSSANQDKVVRYLKTRYSI